MVLVAQVFPVQAPGAPLWCAHQPNKMFKHNFFFLLLTRNSMARCIGEGWDKEFFLPISGL
jgi:hypothetical protein